MEIHLSHLRQTPFSNMSENKIPVISQTIFLSTQTSPKLKLLFRFILLRLRGVCRKNTLIYPYIVFKEDILICFYEVNRI